MTDNWKIVYSDYKPGEELLREALCTLGNGYFATRGAAEECQAGKYHYPGTYLACGYNRLETEIQEMILENEDLVNWPDWTLLKFRHENGEWFDPDKAKIKEYRQELLLKEGILRRYILFSDEMQRETEVVSSRIVSMENKHLAAIELKITPKNWSGKIIVQSALDGSVKNSGVKRYSQLNSQHLKIQDTGNFEEDCIYLKAVTVQSETVMAQAARTRVYFISPDYPSERKTIREENYAAQELAFNAEENKPVTIEKIVAVYTSRDKAISAPLLEAKKTVVRAGRFEELLTAHTRSWEAIWQRCDTSLEADSEEDQLLIRLHIFHLLQTCSLHSVDTDAGIPARGWSGEAYRGHVLWDEIFVLPVLNLRYPEISRSLLMYRYRRLPEARNNAREQGYEGAMFPWQSGSNGREESQVIHLNPESGRWIPDDSCLQRHVNAAIAYNVWQYFQTSEDLEFLSYYGAELLIGIAKFWASIAKYNEEKKRYEILKVVGPDEYHTQYPGASEPGLNNNAYTNIMAVWTLVHALKAINRLEKQRADELLSCLQIDQEDLNRWNEISRNMFVPFLKGGKIIEQFEGFEKLKDLDWKKYHEKYGEIIRLDRVLEKENDDVNNYKAVKQADVLMLFYLFSAEELTEIFKHMGYEFNTKQQIPMNITYYQKITSHGSTLSKLVHSWVFARSHREKSWHSFRKALVSDFKDIQGGTTHEGIHLGAMAGTVDLIQRCYSGMEIRREALWFNPRLPENVKCIKYNLRYRSHWLEICITKTQIILKSQSGWEDGIIVFVKGKKYKLKKGEETTIEFKSPTLRQASA